MWVVWCIRTKQAGPGAGRYHRQQDTEADQICYEVPSIRLSRRCDQPLYTYYVIMYYAIIGELLYFTNYSYFNYIEQIYILTNIYIILYIIFKLKYVIYLLLFTPISID